MEDFVLIVKGIRLTVPHIIVTYERVSITAVQVLVD